MKILDFGLARIGYDAPLPADHSDGADRLTPMAVTGTPDYIAPEQVRAPQRADTRADIYSLACTFFYLLTGRAPFCEATPAATVAAHLHRPAPAIRALRRDVSTGLAAVLERMLAKDPAQRYPTPAEVARALEPYAAAPARVPRRPWRWVALGAAVVGVAALVTAIGLRSLGTAEPIAEPAVQVVAAPALPPEHKPEPPVEAPPPPAAEVHQPEVHEQVVSWLKQHSRFGPNHAFVREQADLVAKQLARGRRVELSIGSGLLKSGKTTLLTTRGSRLFIAEYSAEQVAVLGLAAKGTRMIDVPDHRNPIRATPVVELSDLRIDGADAIDAHQHVTGTVAYRVLASKGGSFALRMHRVPGKKGTTSYQLLKGGIPADRGTFILRFSAFDSAGAVEPTTLPVFVELLAVDDPRRPDLGTVVSNTMIAVVTVAPPK